MMEIALFAVAFLLGAGVYRLGRREGEAGRVLPLCRPMKRDKAADGLLKRIESYNGKAESIERR